MNRYKRSAARSEPQTLNNSDDGIYFVSEKVPSPKVPNIISRNQSRRSISNSNSTINSSVNMSTAACLSNQNQQQQQLVVEENTTPLQQEQQLASDIVVTDGDELPLQEVTTDQQVQIIQDPQDENSGLMYFLLEDGTLAQIDTNAGTPWLNNSNIELQFDGQQQQIVSEECGMDQQEMVKDLCPPPENEMMVVDSELKPEELALEQLTETGIEQQHIDSELQQQVVEPISQLVQPTVIDSEHRLPDEESNFGQVKQNAASVLSQQQLMELSSLDTQPLNLEDLEHQQQQQQQQHEQNNVLEEELLSHHTLHSSNIITGGEGEQKQLNLQQVLSASQPQQPELNLNQQDDPVLNTNIEPAPDLIRQDDISGKEETTIEAHQEEPGPSSLLLESTSEIKRDDEKQVETMEHDGVKQEEEELVNSNQEQLLLEPVDKMNEDQQQQRQQQQEELNQNNPDQESYFLLQINGQTLLLPMSSLSDQNTILDENNQEINLGEQFRIINQNQIHDSSHMPDIASSSNNSSDNPSSFIQIANSVPSNDEVSTVNLATGEDTRPKPYRFVLPPPANAEPSLEPLTKIDENSSTAVTTTTTTAHRQQQSNCQSDIHEDATEQPPIKRFKPGQEEVKTSEPMRKSINIRPGSKIVSKPSVAAAAAGPKTKVGNTCIFRCGACHKLYSTKELALSHMVEVHKADPRTTRTEFRSLETTPKHHKCSKCGNLYQSLELLHKHICNRATSINAASSSHNEKSRSTSTTSFGTSTTTARFDSSSIMKTKLNQLEMEKKSESSVEKTIKSTQQSSVYSTTTTVAGVPERKCYSKNNNNTMSLTKSAVSVAVENQTTTPGLVQNSSKLRTTATALNYPPDLTCCERTFVSLYYYLQHRLIHSREANSSEPWQCEVCQVEFAAKQELLSHFFVHNSDYTPPRKRKSKAQSAAPTSSGAGKVKQTMNEKVPNYSKDKNQISSSHVAAQQTTNKRGRGRPPKVKPSDDDSSATSSVKVEHEKQQQREEKVVVPKASVGEAGKRGRGRPRKSSKDDKPVEKNLNIKSETSVVVKKGKPGRPSLKKDNAVAVTPPKRGRKPKATTLQSTEGDAELKSTAKMASDTTSVSRRSLRNVTTTAVALTNGHNKEMIAERKENSPKSKLRGKRLRCSTQNSNDTSTMVKVEEKEKEAVTPNDIKEESVEIIVNSTPTIDRSDSTRGADSAASTISGVVDEPSVKKNTVKGPTTPSRRHTDELRMRTPASQKRVQDSFVEIFKRVKSNSAEESNIVNRNGGVGSSKPK